MENYNIDENMITSYKEAYERCDEEWDFIWGIKSSKDLLYSGANLHTDNDIEVIFNKREHKYYIKFEGNMPSYEAEKHFKYLLNEFTNWINSSNIFILGNRNTNSDYINNGFDYIGEVYSCFKNWVNDNIIKN